MRHKDAGFTLTELLVTTVISGLILSAAVTILHQVFAENRNLQGWSTGQFEMTMALRELESDIRNIVRLQPPEGVSTREYFGLTSLNAGEEPSQCANGTGASVIRYTTLDRHRQAESLLRAWSEKNDSGKLTAANELRVTADKTPDSLFHGTDDPSEIVLVDADRKYLRRYSTAKVTMNLDYGFDPYDDLAKTDSFGLPILFNFASVLLKNPKGIGGAATPIIDATLITGSEAYASKTYVICLRKSDRSLIKIDEADDSEIVLMNNPTDDFEIERFSITYMATKKGVRVEPAGFQANMAGVNAECINTISFELSLVVSAAVKAAGGAMHVPDTEKILRRRVIFSPNLNSDRAGKCL